MEYLDFLRNMYPKGPWCLTAINPDQDNNAPRTETDTFGPNTEEECVAFVERHMGKWNLYFTVNPIAKVMKKKPERTDIKSLAYLHVDVDPRYGEKLEDEQSRIMALFTTNLPKGVPEPSAVVFSGGGYQAFWKLDEPLALNGTLEGADQAKLWNLQLEHVFGADSCHNIDRIMRLPYTINVPTKKKLDKGRKPVKATVLHATWVAHSLTLFNAAPKVQSPEGPVGGRSSGGIKVEVSGNVERLTDVHGLDVHCPAGTTVPDKIKRIIQFGFDSEDDTGKDRTDRSVWVFHATCALVRLGIPDEVIFSVLTDRDFRISDHVYDQKIGAEKYAIRQIERAKEAAVDPQLEAVNRRYAVVNYDGKVVVMYEESIEIDNALYPLIKTMSFGDFEKLYSNRFVETGEVDGEGRPKLKPLGKWWLAHPNRKQYTRGVHFQPHSVDEPDKYNLWQGFECSQTPGVNHEPYLKHLFDNVCSGNQEHYDYLINWMADAVQFPNRPGGVALVLRGPPGVGKSFLAKHMGRLFGRHYISVTNSKHLVGNFNAHLADKVLIFADEALWHGDKQSLSVLKALITESVRMTERKGFDAVLSPNYVRLILASNDEQVINAQAHERRFFALTVSAGQMQNADYFKEVCESLEQGGYDNLFNFLRTRDLSNFNIRKVPQTEELQAQKNMSLAPHQEWWLQCLVDGKIHPTQDGWAMVCPKDEAFDSYSDYMHKLRVYRSSNKTQLLHHLQEYHPDLMHAHRWVEVRTSIDAYGPEWTTVQKERKKVMCYIFPELDQCRLAYETKHGKQDWGLSDS